MLSLLSKILNPSRDEYKPSTETKTEGGDAIYRALIGDIGGTNIRLRLISFSKNTKVPKVIKSSENMKTN